MTNDVETLLRRTMREQGVRVDGPPVGGEEIVRRGQRVRRTRRWAMVAGVVVVVTGLLGGAVGLGSFRDHSSVVPATGAVPTGPPKVVSVQKDKLSLPGGKTVALPRSGLTGGAWVITPVAGGWVANSSVAAVLVSPAGVVSSLVEGAHTANLSVVASPDGERVAVTQAGTAGNLVQVYQVRTRKLIGTTSLVRSESEVGPPESHVLGWYRDSVVLGSVPPSGLPQVGLWDFAAGPWNGKVSQHGVGIVQGAADGDRLLGYTMDPKGRVCVGFVDPARDFAMSGQSCDFQVTQALVRSFRWHRAGSRLWSPTC
ncbi:hypothetical protein [Fodinicola feengrottensis]|uniref:hypothetical protein n=1 Tax=Fodinicola feengrottensis TaxID=435914 RepID=UPI0013D23C2E|nr:hypothetical protein [Fodinicola feengrottensis]